MSTVPVSVVSPVVSASIVLAVEGAAAAIARLDARVLASPVASGWSRRAAWSGYARALQLQGGEIDEIDVFSWGCGLPIPARPRRVSHTDEFADFAPWLAVLQKDAGPQWRDRLPFSPDIPQGMPRLLTALDLTHRYARRDGGIAPWLAVPDVLQGLGLTKTTLPCLVAGAKAFRWRATISEDLLRPILRSLADAADAGLERLNAMEADYRRGARAIREEYRSTSLARLLALVAARPLVSPQSVASALNMTLGGAGKLLSRADELKLLVEVTGRRAWRLYLAPDLAIGFGFTPAPRGRPPKIPDEPMGDRGMAMALAAFDEEMRLLDIKLGALGASGSSI